MIKQNVFSPFLNKGKKKRIRLNIHPFHSSTKFNNKGMERYLRSKAISFKLRVFALLFISASSGTSFMCFFEYTHKRFLG